MIPIRIVAISTDVAEGVRRTNKAPRYGHPAHSELASGYGPCRHCLQAFKVGEENRTLFTYDSFEGLDVSPLPGPVFIHSEACIRYPEEGGYPEGLLPYASVLDAYAQQRRLVSEVLADGGSQPQAIRKLLERSKIVYVHVRDKNAGCYGFRVERGAL